MSEATYNQLFTMHGSIMMFLFAVPMAFGLANYLVPLQIGAPDMAFPRLNALSFWLFLGGGLMMVSSFLTSQGAPAFGWTAYAPLSDAVRSPGAGADLWIVALIITGVGTILTAVNLITTVVCLRAPGMVMFRMPIFTWNMLIVSVMVILAFPVLTSGLSLLWADRHLGSTFFEPAQGGIPVLWQHLFWFFGHPEVYIVALPFFGVVTEIIPVFSRKPLFGYRGFVFATLAIAALSTGVWAHHMFATGAVNLPFFSGMTMLIAVPTGVKMFNWIGTMWRGHLTLRDAHALLHRVPAGVPHRGADRAHDRCVAPVRRPRARHLFHRGPHALRPLRDGRLRVLRRALLLVPQVHRPPPARGAGQAQLLADVRRLQPHLLAPPPARAPGHAPPSGRLLPRHRVGALNVLSSVGSAVLGLSVLVLLVNLWRTATRGEPAGDDPWGGYSLEWATSSPPPEHNFHSLPTIRSERPVFDARQGAPE